MPVDSEVDHDPREHALFHVWKAARYYAALEAMRDIIRIDSKKDKVPNIEKRLDVLDFVSKMLDYCVENELKIAYQELQRYLGVPLPAGLNEALNSGDGSYRP